MGNKIKTTFLFLTAAALFCTCNKLYSMEYIEVVDQNGLMKLFPVETYDSSKKCFSSELKKAKETTFEVPTTEQVYKMLTSSTGPSSAKKLNFQPFFFFFKGN